jgi:hypothetical protein
LNAHERVKLWLVGLMLSLLLSGAAEAADKNKTVRITNRQGTQAQVYINFAADSVLKPTDVPFCKVTGSLNCEFTLAANSSRDIPNPQAKYLNMALAFNAPVTCGSTKAEVLVNNPNWFDVLDVSVVDGFNEKIQINLTPTGGSMTQLGPPVGKLGNQKVFGVFPTAARFARGSKTRRAGIPAAANASRGRSPSPMFYVSTK